MPVGGAILLGALALFLGAMVWAYFVNREDDGSLTGWAQIGMLLSTIAIVGTLLIPTIGALVGELVGRRSGDRGSLIGTALGALAGPVGFAVFYFASGDPLIAVLTVVSGAGAAAVLTLAVLAHQHALRRTALNTEGSQPPG